MKAIWDCLNQTKMETQEKNGLFLLTVTVFFALLGGLLWCILGRIILPSVEWLVCFIGYPAIFGGYINGIFYLWKHSFS